MPAAAWPVERVGDLLPSGRQRVELAAVDGDATVLECAAVMARLHSPLLVVVEEGQVRGLLTAAHLLEVLLPAEGEGAGDQLGEQEVAQPDVERRHGQRGPGDHAARGG